MIFFLLFSNTVLKNLFEILHKTKFIDTGFFIKKFNLKSETLYQKIKNQPNI